MTSLPTIGLLIAAGAALVAQNLVMTRISASASTVLIALVTNSAVGLVVLTALLVWRNGAGGVAEVVGKFRLWSVLPGLLGSFFVFASLAGYQRIGAAPTISVLVASQLLFGLVVDLAKPNSGDASANFFAILGSVLLVAGVVLVLYRRF